MSDVVATANVGSDSIESKLVRSRFEGRRNGSRCEACCWVMALVAVAHADGFPASGPCDDIDACEKACKGQSRGHLLLGRRARPAGCRREPQGAGTRAVRSRVLARPGGRVLASGSVLDRDDDAALKAKARGAYQRACNMKHARACFAFARILSLAGDDKSKKLAEATQKKAIAILEGGCTKEKLAGACSWVAELYGSGALQDLAKAETFREQACQLSTGKPCPPKPEPSPSRPHTKPYRKQATTQE
jgi:hypothetical protein